MPERFPRLRRLLDPPPGCTPDIEPARYRLFSAVALVFVPIPLLYALIHTLLEPAFAPAGALIVLTVALMLGCYGLHRRGRSRLAIRLFLGVFQVSILLSLLLAPPMSALLEQFILSGPVLLAVTFLPFREQVTYTLSGLAGLLLVDFLAPPLPSPGLLAVPLGFYLLFSALALLLTRYRDLQEAALAAREARFRLLADHSPDILYRFRLQPPAGFEYLSPSAERLTGLPLEELYRHPNRLWELIHPDDRATLFRNFQTLPTAEPVALRWRLPDGRLRWLEARNRLVYDANGLPLAAEGVARDVTEAVQARRELERRVRHIQQLQQANLTLSRSLDLDTVLDDFLEVLAHLVPYDTANVMLLDTHGTLRTYRLRGYERWTDVERIRQITFSAQQDRKFRQMVLNRQSILIPDTRQDPRWQPLPGTEYIRCWLGVPLVAGGRVLGVFSVDSATPGGLDDEHRRVAEALAAPAALAIHNALLYRELEDTARTLEQRVHERTQELQQRYQESERLNRALLNVLEDLNATVERLNRTARQLRQAHADLETFVDTVVHDLRAPLRAMEGFAEAVLEDYGPRLDATGQEYLERIHRAAAQMDALIEDLRAFFQVTRRDLRLQAVPLEQVIAEARSLLEERLERRQAVIHIDGPLPTVIGHATTLVQVVVNLLSNAVKFVAPGVRPQVCLWAERQGDWVHLYVRDNGIGIPAEDQERIFQPFERLHGVEAYPGTGVGLAIVQRGVERMGGRVGVQSTPGEGSLFWIALRAADASPTLASGESA